MMETLKQKLLSQKHRAGVETTQPAATPMMETMKTEDTRNV